MPQIDKEARKQYNKEYYQKNKEKYKCEHNRQRSQCKDCNGVSICEHSRIRSSCKDCKGGCICEHNRDRSKCKECKGASICEHTSYDLPNYLRYGTEMQKTEFRDVMKN
jgi:hypothetical protein